MPRTRIKICGLTRSLDVVQAANAGVDAVGFVFAPKSPRRLGPAEAASLVSSVPAFVSRVGLFQDQDAGEIDSILSQVNVSELQFHGSESAEFCAQFGLPYIKAVSMKADGQLGDAASSFRGASALLLDSHEVGQAGGTGRTFDWQMVENVGMPLIIAGGLTPENVGAAVRGLKPWGVDVSSGVEDSPGIKSHELIERFVTEVRNVN